jgi:hypothetical protein
LAKITLADLTGEPTTIDMFDHSYRVLAVTRSVQKKLEKVQSLLDGLEDEDDADKVVAAMADSIDTLLQGEEGSPPAKKVIVDAWKNDTLSLPLLRALFDSVQEASVARPT